MLRPPIDRTDRAWRVLLSTIGGALFGFAPLSWLLGGAQWPIDPFVFLGLMAAQGQALLVMLTPGPRREIFGWYGLAAMISGVLVMWWAATLVAWAPSVGVNPALVLSLVVATPVTAALTALLALRVCWPPANAATAAIPLLDKTPGA